MEPIIFPIFLVANIYFGDHNCMANMEENQPLPSSLSQTTPRLIHIVAEACRIEKSQGCSDPNFCLTGDKGVREVLWTQRNAHHEIIKRARNVAKSIWSTSCKKMPFTGSHEQCRLSCKTSRELGYRLMGQKWESSHWAKYTKSRLQVTRKHTGVL